MGKENEIKIKVETGGAEEKKETKEQQQSVGQVQQPQVVPNALGYLNQTQAMSAGVPPTIPGAPAVNLMKPEQPVNHPEVDLMNPQMNPLPKGADKAMQDLSRTIDQARQLSPVEKGYEEQTQLDAIAELINEQKQRTQDAQQKVDSAEGLDESALRNERSRKVIAGLGDAISSIVNLVGTSNGAYDQHQTFMEPRLRDVIEQDRAKRRLNMDKLRANLQNQVNAENNLRLTLAKMDESRRQQAEALRAKQNIANQQNAFRVWESQQKIGLQREKNASDAAIKLEQLKEQNRHNRANEYIGSQRNSITEQHYKDIKERNSGGSGSGKWYDTINYDEFKEEMARSLGYSSWSDALSNGRRGDDRKILNEIALADNPTKQRAVIQSYIDHVPQWQKKYWPGGIAPEEAVQDGIDWDLFREGTDEENGSDDEQLKKILGF